MRKVKTIKDPVHGYVTVAAHESIIVDHPITQRLRRINQTGLAELVYPEARSSRFAHSLGAMHLASQFLTSCLENADEKVAAQFFNDLQKEVDHFAVTAIDVDRLLQISTHAGSGLSAGRIAFRNETLKKHRDLLAVSEAAVRLAALYHDLGHLPFSHDFEFALRDFIAEDLRARKSQSTDPLRTLRSGLPPHERIGHRLAEVALLTIVQEANPTPLEREAFSLAIRILDHEERYDEVPSPHVTALGWLHALVDGEIDVDRADFLLRDGWALGLAFADYDLPRLIANLKLVWHPDLGYSTAVREQALSTIESFYLARSRTNQVLVRHHKTAQIGAALRLATMAVLRSGRAHAFLDAIRALIAEGTPNDQAQDALLDFAICDDSWWIHELHAVEKGTDDLLDACLELVLWRKSTLRSLWKRKGDLSPDQLKKLNAVADGARQDLSKFEEARKRLLDLGALLALHRFRPFGLQVGQQQLKSVALIETNKGQLLAATDISPLMQSLFTSWQQDIHLHAFSVHESVTPETILEVFAQK